MSEHPWHEKFESGMLWLDHRIGDLSRNLRKPFKYPYTTYFGLGMVAFLLAAVSVVNDIRLLGFTGAGLLFICFVAMLPTD